MKTPFLLSAFAFLFLLIGCGGEDPETNRIKHKGEKWNIVSMEYNVIDLSLTSPMIKSGTQNNAGAFYFDQSSGSFDIRIDNWQKEDVFGFSEKSGEITIISVQQNVSVSSFSQNVIAITGQKNSSSSMALQGTITNQSLSGELVFTGSFTLSKN